MACIDSREVKCEQDILTAIIDAPLMNEQGTDGNRVILDGYRQYFRDARGLETSGRYYSFGDHTIEYKLSEGQVLRYFRYFSGFTG